MTFPDFRPEEFACHHCNSHGIRLVVVEILQTLRNILNQPIYVTSGYRCPAHPTELAKPQHAARVHSQGWAVDFVVPTVSPSLVRETLVDMGWSGLGFDPRRVYFHADCAPRNHITACWLYRPDGSYQMCNEETFCAGTAPFDDV